MVSTFHGLETARRGMTTQQYALQVTGQNIANANTTGYSRQRVNFTQTEPYPAPAMNRPQVPGQMGTGVQAGSIQRVREGYLDQQFRGENNKYGYWSAKSEAMEKMEDIMNEPSDNGLSKTMDRFWQSLQDLSVHPEDSGARSVVLQRGTAVAETFNYLSNSLTSIQKDIGSQLDTTVLEANSLLTQINGLNKQIGEIEPHKYLPNDLYDQRDALVDKLSQIVNISVEKVGSGGQSLDMAEGKYTIKLLDKNGTAIGTLVDGSDTSKVNEIKAVLSSDKSSLTSLTLKTGEDLAGTDMSGRLQGLKDSLKTDYPDMIKKLDNMASGFVAEFNRLHSGGYGLDSNSPSTNTGKNFFSGSTASDIKVILTNRNDVAAGSGGYSGDGGNALKLANVKNSSLPYGGETTSLQGYYEGAIGKMAVDSQEAARLADNSLVLSDSVENRRQSVSGVSIDEEMTNLIQFQHAFNAAARNITVVDEMLDKIINGMGVGGR
ncbi:flagellar hook-associated protein FlgK [Fictibacillus sp. KIGAM418]|uniref:Flagellar hook-associated protein 1 n=1 Tax=Fictibacillus marinisediminis TaxID=2878389 RepID=A0A9X1XF22_9BACL|nr:flagellar hook-associated protein FlgK [Fictibacillus marinisediminis]MCK6258680.1 flagellar hook-associated protein FlgK [Fictibacillus marinisediminis]